MREAEGQGSSGRGEAARTEAYLAAMQRRLEHGFDALAQRPADDQQHGQ
jgi:hypothetical protein